MVVHKRYGKCRVLKNDGKKLEILCLRNSKTYVLDIEFCVTQQLIRLAQE